MRVVGLISGTSMDGIDAAVIDIDRRGDNLSFELRTFVSVPYPPQIRAALENVTTDLQVRQPVRDLCSLNFSVGEAFATAAKLALQEVDGAADLIGSHGQTICHLPQPDAASGLVASTLQIGEAALIAQRTGLTCVADFRVADVAAGGQGAPLVSYVDYLLLRSPTESRVALNIGGIANVTVLPAGCTASQVRAFDTGPGNMLIDRAVCNFYPSGAGFDRSGGIASRGKVHATLLELLLTDGYFSRLSPKTAGREQFGADFFNRTWTKAQSLGCARDDLIATFTELTARTIADALPKDCSRVIAGGGGVHNAALMDSLRRNISRRPSPPAVVHSTEFGLPVDAKEAIAFAILAFETLHGRSNNLPASTGAKHPVVLGKIAPGANFAALMRTVWAMS